jgi:hypothetical protein
MICIYQSRGSKSLLRFPSLPMCSAGPVVGSWGAVGRALWTRWRSHPPHISHIAWPSWSIWRSLHRATMVGRHPRILSGRNRPPRHWRHGCKWPWRPLRRVLHITRAWWHSTVAAWLRASPIGRRRRSRTKPLLRRHSRTATYTATWITSVLFMPSSRSTPATQPCFRSPALVPIASPTPFSLSSRHHFKK